MAERLNTTELSQLRASLHRQPELSENEYATTDYMRGKLLALGLEEISLGLKTGCVMCLAGKRPGRTVVLRADMDALPIQEETNAPSASIIPKVMHACGHDVHMAALYGAAALLSAERDTLCGRVLFLLQAAEENVVGAQEVINTGIFSKFEISAMLAIHVWPLLPLGVVGLCEGAIMAAKDRFILKLHGTGGHGSNSGIAGNTILAGSAAALAINKAVAEYGVGQERVSATVCAFNAGCCDNVLPEESKLLGNLRSFSQSERQRLHSAIECECNKAAQQYGCMAELIIQPQVPALVNDAKLVRELRTVALNSLGENSCCDIDPVMISEDFARYCQYAPCCCTLFGVGDQNGGSKMLHSPKFYPDDAAIEPAARFLANAAERLTQ